MASHEYESQVFSASIESSHTKVIINEEHLDEDNDCYLIVVDDENNKENSDEQTISVKSKYPTTPQRIPRRNSEIGSIRVYGNKKKVSPVESKTKKEQPVKCDDFENSMETFFIVNDIPDKLPATVIKNEDNEQQEPNDAIEVTQENLQEPNLITYDNENNIQEISDQHLLKIFTEDDTILLKNDTMVQHLIDSGQLIIKEEDAQEVILCESEEQQYNDETEIVLEFVDESNIQEVVDIYTCNCGKQFQNLQEFEKHQESHNEDVKSSIVLQESLKVYLSNYEEQYPNLVELVKQKLYQCNICDECYTTVELLDAHLLSHDWLGKEKSKKKCTPKQPAKKRPKYSLFMCEVCSKTFKYRITYKHHMMRHVGETKFKCEICNKGFIQKISLQTHSFTHINPVTCSQCDLIFKDKDTFECHKVDGVCPKSSKEEIVQAFKQEVIVNRKMLGYVCKFCEKMFPTEDKLEFHISTSHIMDSNSLLCFECGEEAPSLAKLQEHILTHDKRKGGKQFSCNQCDRVFYSNARLLVHERVHTNERPFSCLLCPRTFKTKTHLQTHQLTHTRERKFECTICDKSFALKGNLVSHLRTHTGEKPYVCPLCGEAFMDSKQLKKHKQTDHRNCDTPWEEYLNTSYTRSGPLALNSMRVGAVNSR